MPNPLHLFRKWRDDRATDRATDEYIDLRNSGITLGSPELVAFRQRFKDNQKLMGRIDAFERIREFLDHPEIIEERERIRNLEDPRRAEAAMINLLRKMFRHASED